MANDKDKLFEKIYFLWKGEGEKRNQSIDWFCERYHADVDEFRKWYQGINHSVKEVQVVGRPAQLEVTNPASETAATAMQHLREQQETEARIVVTTSEAGKKQKPAIASLTINLGNGLHMTRKGMSFDEFFTFAQNLKALC